MLFVSNVVMVILIVCRQDIGGETKNALIAIISVQENKIMEIDNKEKFYLSMEQRNEIEKQIEFFRLEEKRMRIVHYHLLKITNLKNKLRWDDCLKN